MRKNLFFALAVLSTLAGAAPASAMDTGKTYNVIYEGYRTGTWALRNRVVDRNTSCEYTVAWKSLTGGPPLGRTKTCVVQELKAGNDLDCEEARRSAFNTIVQKKSGKSCGGFDDFGQEIKVERLIAGESTSGQLNGIVQTSSIGDVQNLVVRPRS